MSTNAGYNNNKTVQEDVNNPVIKKQVQPHLHEDVNTAVDKDVVQDHHHTTVQPVQAQETLPEQHHQNVAPTTHKTVEHGDQRQTRNALDREASKFKNSTDVGQTTHSTSTGQAQVNEHVQHNVHEHVQPVIQKETVQPHVVHTTVPVQETHHAEPIHEGTTVMPTKTVGQLENETGVSGSGRHNASADGVGAIGTGAAGHRGNVSDVRQTTHANSRVDDRNDLNNVTGGQTTGTRGNDLAGHDGLAQGRGVGNETLHGTHATGDRVTGDRHSTTHTTDTSGVSTRNGAPLKKTQPHAGSTAPGTGHAGSHTSTTDHSKSTHTNVDASGKKPSMAAKLNPFKDADGDGHKGIMS